MSKKILLIALLLYIASAGISYGVFSSLDKPATSSTTTTGQTAQDGTSPLAALLSINPSEPVDQLCPVNGKFFTSTEKQAWEKRRPLFVMIENAPDARPQAGLSKADLVFEAIAEGGVTRFGAIFYCGAQIADVTLAPIRSARTYFVDWASGFNNPMYVHVGGANVPGPADALGQISDYGWNQENDVNQFSVGYPTFYRDYNRVPGKELATEHTMVTTTEKLWKVAQTREWTNIEPSRKIGKKTIGGTDWKEGFKPWTYETAKPEVGTTTTISYDYWSGYNQYTNKWTYDAQKAAYLREMGGEKHIDSNNDEHIAASNVIVMLTDEKGPIDEKKHMLYRTTGKGDALIFKHGTVIKATWAKKDREAQLVFTDAKGKEIEFARGLTWISVVDVSTEVAY